MFQRWRAGQFQLATSPGILAEVADVLHRRHIIGKYQLTEAVIDDHLNALRTEADFAPGLLVLDVVPDDPEDNHVVASAVETHCEYIVSGDRHLLDLRIFQSIHIVTPREFLTLLDTL